MPSVPFGAISKQKSPKNQTTDPPGLLLEQAAQHPGGFFVHIDALGQHVGAGLIVASIHHGKQLSGRARRGLLRGDQMAHHVVGLGHTVNFVNGGEFRKRLVRSRRWKTQGTDALSDQVQRGPLFGVLLHEHVVQAVELRPRHVPVKIVCHQVQGVAVGQKNRQAVRNFLSMGLADADVDGGGFGGC